MSNKITLVKGLDQEVSIEVQEWELRTSGALVQTGASEYAWVVVKQNTW